MDITEQIQQQIKDNPILLYMKGTPQFPMCGFSSRTVDVLKACNQKFAFVNILMDQDVRANLPKVSNWPTFPQLFIKGELVGGCDIVTELAESGELQTMIDAAAADAAAADAAAADAGADTDQR